ncbi:MAG: SRPBCC family protein [Ignavibacteria bacterium]
MNIFETSILIDSKIKDAFDFHSDTNNLVKISPDNIKVSIIKLDLPLKEGSIIELKISQFGIISNKWKLQIKNLKPFNLITDKMISGPFKYWEHDHIFTEENGKTLMTDSLKYELPFGIIGKLADKIFLKRMIKKQFEIRHWKTKEILERNNIQKFS